MEDSEGDCGGDESILYQARTDLASDDADDDMYCDEETSDVDEFDVDKQIDILKGFLDKMGLMYKDVVTISTKTIKGMVICNMHCQINTKTRLHVKQVRKEMSDAIIASVRDIVAQVRRNLSNNEVLADEKQNLVKFCQESRKVEPEYESWLEDGFYRAKVVVGKEEAIAGVAFHLLEEAEGSAAKLWLQLWSRVVEKKPVLSEAFDMGDNEDVLCKDNWVSEISFSRKEGGKESSKRPELGGFFSYLDNITEDEISKSGTGINATEEDLVEKQPVKTKKSISSVFDVDDDPMVLEIMARNKKEAEKLAGRTEVKTNGRKRISEFSQSLELGQSLDSISQKSFKGESKAKFKIPKTKKNTKDQSQKKINPFFLKGSKASKKKLKKKELEEVGDYTPSIDELLKLPDCVKDGGKTMDDLDKEIADRKMKHDEEMAKIDTDIAAEKRRQEERRERMKSNAVDRDRLEAEVTEDVLRRMFRDNLDYLKKIKIGEVESSRHQAYNKSCRTRHALYYTMITDPFTDYQLEWTLDEISQVWMRNKKEQMDNNEYVWKVLLAECFIKFYMDHFSVSKEEAEKRISETPLRKTEGSSDNEDSSDEEL